MEAGPGAQGESFQKVPDKQNTSLLLCTSFLSVSSSDPGAGTQPT